MGKAVPPTADPYGCKAAIREYAKYQIGKELQDTVTALEESKTCLQKTQMEEYKKEEGWKRYTHYESKFKVFTVIDLPA
jgi:hypothetical protein